MRSSILGLLAVTLPLLLLAQPVLAEEENVLDKGVLDALPAPIYKALGNEARKNMANAKIDDTKFVGKETPAQLQDPLLSAEERKRVIDRGVISAYAQWCGFNYKRTSFSPFMQYERGKGGLAQKQVVYMGLLHDMTMKKIAEQTARKGACPQDVKEKVEALIIE